MFEICANCDTPRYRTADVVQRPLLTDRHLFPPPVPPSRTKKKVVSLQSEHDCGIIPPWTMSLYFLCKLSDVKNTLTFSQTESVTGQDTLTDTWYQTPKTCKYLTLYLSTNNNPSFCLWNLKDRAVFIIAVNIYCSFNWQHYVHRSPFSIISHWKVEGVCDGNDYCF